jgi:tetratricopeptide (TPR) repeat protein
VLRSPVKYALFFIIALGFSKDCLTSLEAAESVGTVASLSQVLPVPASTAMGGTIFFPDNNPSSILVNPALAAYAYRSEVSYCRAFQAQNTAYDLGAANLVTRIGNLSVAYGGTDFFNTASFNYSATISKSVPITYELFALGINVNYNSIKTNATKSAGLTYDIGCVAPIGFNNNLKMGAVFKNAGAGMKSLIDSDSLPSSFSLGFLFKLPTAWNANIVTDVTRDIRTDEFAYAFGASVSPVSPLVLRAGWKETKDSQFSGLSSGAELLFSHFRLSYAVTPFPSGVLMKSSSLVQQLSIEVPFGPITRPLVAYDYYLKYYYEAAVRDFNRADYLSARNEFSNILTIYRDHEPSKLYLKKINERLGQVEEQRSSRVNELIRKAQVAASKNDLVKTGAYLEEVMSIDPNNRTAQELYIKIGGAIKLANRGKAIETNKKDIKYLWDDGIRNYNKGNYVKAKEDFEKILETDPENLAVKKNLTKIEEKLSKITSMQINEIYLSGIELFKKGEYEDAKKHFESVVLADPGRLDAKDYIAKCNSAITKVDSPNSQISGISPSAIALKYSQAADLINNEDYEKALGLLQEAQKMAKESGSTNYSEGIEQNIILCKKKLAEKYFTEGLALSRVENQPVQIDAVAEKFKKALSFDPDNEMIKKEYGASIIKLAQKYYEEGMAYVESGNNIKARELFRRSLAYDPNKLEALRALERIK